MTRFVILEHDHPSLHWDFMLEAAGVLRTWRLPNPPGRGEMAAEEIADHRLAYLDYEGPVSGGRGSVKRWDHGRYELVSSSPDEMEIVVIGEKAKSHVRMTRGVGRTWRTSWNEIAK